MPNFDLDNFEKRDPEEVRLSALRAGMGINELNLRTSGDMDEAIFWIDNFGDIHDSIQDAELIGTVAGMIRMDSMFVGSLDKMRSYALASYQSATFVDGYARS